MKDPAFLFYSSDFLIGCSTLTNEECGKYIRLLCYMHQKGRLKKETMIFLVGPISENLFSMFDFDENNHFFNKRLEIESEKRSSWVTSRRENAKVKSKKNDLSKDKAYAKAKSEHMEDRDENENINENKDIVYPFDNKKFHDAWILWLSYKKETYRFTYKTDKSEQAALKKIGDLSGGDIDKAVYLIQFAIERQWQGFYQDDNYGKQTNKPKQRGYDPTRLTEFHNATFGSSQG